MKFTKVDKSKVYEQKPVHKLKAVFIEFMSLNIEVAEVTFQKGEQANINSAWKSLWQGSKRWAVPVKVVKRKDKIYLIRTDM